MLPNVAPKAKQTKLYAIVNNYKYISEGNLLMVGNEILKKRRIQRKNGGN